MDDRVQGCWGWRERDLSCGCSESGDGVCIMGVIVKELCENVVEIGKVSDCVCEIVICVMIPWVYKK